MIEPTRREDRIEFYAPPRPTGPAANTGVTLIGPLSWARQPIPEFPERAESRGIEAGIVTFQCGFDAEGLLQDCTVITEYPAGAGFGQAALRAAHTAQLSSATVGTARAGDVVRITFHFRSDFPFAPTGYLAAPESIPPEVLKAAVTVNCAVATDGALSDCRVIEETPPALGFGEVAVEAAGHGRVSPRTVEGATAGRATFTLSFP